MFRSRYFLHQDAFKYQQQQIDFFHFSTFNLNTANKLSIGFYYRNRDWSNSGSDELRFLKQLDFIKQKTSIRYRHRFRLEQRIFNNFTAFRQRYRFAVDFPLNGDAFNIGTTFFTGTLEGLFSLSKNRAPLVNKRTSAKIGWQLNSDLKLQTGLEYRFESFNINAKNYLFLLTSAVLKI